MLIRRYGSQPSFFTASALGPTLIAFVVLSVLALWQPHKQALTDNGLYGNGAPGEQWKVITEIPAGSSVAAFGPGEWRYYPLFGPHLEMHPMRVQEDGRRYIDLHVRIRDRRTRWLWWPIQGRETDPNRVLTNNSRAGPPDLSRLIINLRDAGVHFILVTKAFQSSWPPQKAILDQSPYALPSYSDNETIVYRLMASGALSN